MPTRRNTNTRKEKKLITSLETQVNLFYQHHQDIQGFIEYDKSVIKAALDSINEKTEQYKQEISTINTLIKRSTREMTSLKKDITILDTVKSIIRKYEIPVTKGKGEAGIEKLINKIKKDPTIVSHNEESETQNGWEATIRKILQGSLTDSKIKTALSKMAVNIKNKTGDMKLKESTHSKLIDLGEEAKKKKDASSRKYNSIYQIIIASVPSIEMQESKNTAIAAYLKNQDPIEAIKDKLESITVLKEIKEDVLFKCNHVNQTHTPLTDLQSKRIQTHLERIYDKYLYPKESQCSNNKKLLEMIAEKYMIEPSRYASTKFQIEFFKLLRKKQTLSVYSTFNLLTATKGEHYGLESTEKKLGERLPANLKTFIFLAERHRNKNNAYPSQFIELYHRQNEQLDKQISSISNNMLAACFTSNIMTIIETLIFEDNYSTPLYCAIILLSFLIVYETIKQQTSNSELMMHFMKQQSSMCKNENNIMTAKIEGHANLKSPVFDNIFILYCGINFTSGAILLSTYYLMPNSLMYSNQHDMIMNHLSLNIRTFILIMIMSILNRFYPIWNYEREKKAAAGVFPIHTCKTTDFASIIQMKLILFREIKAISPYFCKDAQSFSKSRVKASIDQSGSNILRLIPISTLLLKRLIINLISSLKHRDTNITSSLYDLFILNLSLNIIRAKNNFFSLFIKSFIQRNEARSKLTSALFLFSIIKQVMKLSQRCFRKKSNIADHSIVYAALIAHVNVLAFLLNNPELEPGDIVEITNNNILILAAFTTLRWIANTAYKNEAHSMNMSHEKLNTYLNLLCPDALKNREETPDDTLENPSLTKN